MLHLFTKPNFLTFVLAICLCSFSSVSAQIFNDMIPPADFLINNTPRNAKSVKSIDDTPLLTTITPPNDLCEDAILLTSDGTIKDIEITNATQDDAPHNFIDGRPAVCAAYSTNIGIGVWYTFIGNGETFDFEVDDSNSTSDLEIAIYTGTCGDLTCLAGSDNPESLYDLQTELNETYYIYIGSWAHYSYPSGTFDFTITGGVSDPNPCELNYEMEIVTSESGCSAGPANRVVTVTFSGISDNTEYDMNAQGGAIITPKGAGVYQVTGNGIWNITANGGEECSTIAESNELPYVSDASTTQETGVAKNDGSATVEVTGGTAPYDVEWSNDVTGTIDASGESHTISGLAAGSYEAVITDDDGIISKVCITVTRKTTGGRGGRGRGKTADAIISNSLIAQPNPFVHTTTVQFNLPEDAFTTLSVYNLSGKLMNTIYEGQTDAGQDYRVELNATSWASGVYILHLTTDKGHVEHQRLLVTK